MMTDAVLMRILVALAIVTAALAATPRQATASTEETAMYDTIISLTRKSAFVGLAKVQPEGTVSGGFLLHDANIVQGFKGPAGGQLSLKVPDQGKHTSSFGAAPHYLLFLTRAGDGEFVMTDLSGSPAVVDQAFDKVVANMIEYVEVASSEAPPNRMKALVFNNLESDVPFLQNDAAAEAFNIIDWTEAEIERLIEIINGETGVSPLPMNASENIAITVMGRGSPDAAVEFASRRLSEQRLDEIYLGLNERTDTGKAVILDRLLTSSDQSVKLGAVKVAGLLRERAVLERVRSEERKLGNIAAVDAINEALGLVDQ